jgi:hypothetical protein
MRALSSAIPPQGCAQRAVTQEQGRSCFGTPARIGEWRSVLPQVLEPVRRLRGVDFGAGKRAVPRVVRHAACVHAVVCELETAGVAQSMGITR